MGHKRMEQQNEQFNDIVTDILKNGYSVCDNFLTILEIENLIVSYNLKFDLGIFLSARIGQKNDEKWTDEIRGDQILWLNQLEADGAEDVFFNKINAFIKYLNQTCYLGIKGEEFHYAKYQKGKFYRRHRDSFQTKKNRILSVILYLNTNWKIGDGGNLLIYPMENNIETTIEINPIAGRLVCFESDRLDHEVLETFVDRLSVTGWFLNI